ncbi:TPA: hypothetical protein N2D99_002449 [Clostridium botulinum]|nr:hypothetical protein [Clostridium botulinum]
MSINSDLRNKPNIFNNEEYVIEEPLGTGEFYWKVRNINNDTTEDISVSLLKAKIKSYDKDLSVLESISTNFCIQCPHCNYKHEDFQNYIDTGDMDGEFSMDCEKCGKSFQVNFVTKIEFTTVK